MDVNAVSQIIAAVGGLGAAAFGLVDATKAIGGGVNHIGFDRIRGRIIKLTPDAEGVNTLSQPEILNTLQANWFNGTDLASQKAIAKSLIKLNLNANNAGRLAETTRVNADLLKAVATKIGSGTQLSSAESDVYSRFDFIVTALLDETYQHADDVYRNWTRIIAALVAVALSLAGGKLLSPPAPILERVLVGLLATPLAPVAKDLSTALATAVNALQVVRK